MNLFEAFGYPLLAVSALQVYLGILLLRSNRRGSPINTSVAVFSFFSAAYVLSNAVAYIRAGMGLEFNFFIRAAWIGWFSIPAGLQFIFYLRDEKSPTPRRIGWVLYPFWGVVLLLCLFTDLVEPGDPSLIPYINRTGPLEDPLRVIGSLMILWVIYEIIRTRRRVTGLRRAQLSYFFHGTLIFAVGGALIVGVIQIFGGFGLNPALGAYLSLPWVALTFYAITRYRLFDIRVVLSGSLAIALLSVLFFLVNVLLVDLLRPALGAVLAFLIVPSLIGAAFFGTTFSKRVYHGIRHLIVKDRYDYQASLRDSIHAVTTILDLDDLITHIFRSVRRSFRAGTVRLFLGDETGRFVQRYGPETERRITVPDAVGAAVNTRTRAVVREEIEALLPPELADPSIKALRRIDVELLVPLLYTGRVRGFLSVSEKGSGEPYDESDIDLLEALAAHAAVALENARLYDEVRRSKESLHQSEAKFRAFAETTPAAIVIYQDGKFRYANPAAQAIVGFPTTELMTMEFGDIVHPAYRDLVRRIGLMIWSVDGSPEQYEFKVLRQDGDERWVLMTAGRMNYDGRDAIIATLFDITERKQLEGKLRVAQRMEAIGKLAGGVAHDFNNILSTIVGHSSLLHAKMGAEDPRRKHVDEILASTERASNLTRSLLAFGRKQAVAPRPTDLNCIVQNAEKLLGDLLGDAVRLKTDLYAGRLDVLADGTQLERVIMNLAVNGRDAMPDGGTLTIETGSVAVDDEFVRVHGYMKRGTYGVITVRDTGIGMDEATKKKIFEPFFTTKGSGKGTGFGLAIVYDIVKRHGGYITVDSEPGKGAAFRVFLPPTFSGPGERGDHPLSGLEGTETILVADDDEQLRSIVRAVLEAKGYRVVEVSNGEDALQKLLTGNGSIHLALLDYIMPGMNGAEVFGALSARRSKVKTLFMSGCSEDHLLRKGLLDPGQKFILKPFDPRELLERVRERLDDEGR